MKWVAAVLSIEIKSLVFVIGAKARISDKLTKRKKNGTLSVQSNKKNEGSITNGYLLPTWRCTSAPCSGNFSIPFSGSRTAVSKYTSSISWLRTSEFKLIPVFAVTANMETGSWIFFSRSSSVPSRWSLLSQRVSATLPPCVSYGNQVFSLPNNICRIIEWNVSKIWKTFHRASARFVTVIVYFHWNWRIYKSNTSRVQIIWYFYNYEI